MKDKKINSTFIWIFLFLLLTFNVSSNEINFEAENIETSGENFISASKNIVITDEYGNKIYGDKLSIDNKKKIYIITDNVRVENITNKIIINANKIRYNQKNSIINTIGKTDLNKELGFYMEDVEPRHFNKLVYDSEVVTKLSNDNAIQRS